MATTQHKTTPLPEELERDLSMAYDKLKFLKSEELVYTKLINTLKNENASLDILNHEMKELNEKLTQEKNKKEENIEEVNKRIKNLKESFFDYENKQKIILMDLQEQNEKVEHAKSLYADVLAKKETVLKEIMIEKEQWQKEKTHWLATKRQVLELLETLK